MRSDPQPRLSGWARRWGLKVIVLVVAFLMYTPAAWAERACANPVGRTCSESTCLRLQGVVESAKSGTFRCRLLNQCPDLILMQSRWVRLATARESINSICWGGGDPGHRQAAAQAWTNVRNCNMRIAINCDGCPWDDFLETTATRTGPAPSESVVVPDEVVELIENLVAAGEWVDLMSMVGEEVER